MKKLFYVLASLTTGGFNLTVSSSEIVKETEKQINTKEKLGSKSLIYKKDLCLPDAVSKTSVGKIEFEAHCFEADLENMKSQVQNLLVAELDSYLKTINTLKEHHDNGANWVSA